LEIYFASRSSAHDFSSQIEIFQSAGTLALPDRKRKRYMQIGGLTRLQQAGGEPDICERDRLNWVITRWHSNGYATYKAVKHALEHAPERKEMCQLVKDVGQAQVHFFAGA
jgi:hypothetical protein